MSAEPRGPAENADWQNRQCLTEYLTDVSREAKFYQIPASGVLELCQEMERNINELTSHGGCTNSAYKLNFYRLLTAFQNFQAPCRTCVDLVNTVDRGDAAAPVADPINRYVEYINACSTCVEKAKNFKAAYLELLCGVENWRQASPNLSRELQNEIEGGISGADAVSAILVAVASGTAAGAAGGFALAGFRMVTKSEAAQVLCVSGMVALAGGALKMWRVNQRRSNHLSAAGIRLMDLAGRLNCQLEQFKALNIRHCN